MNRRAVQAAVWQGVCLLEATVVTMTAGLFAPLSVIVALFATGVTHLIWLCGPTGPSA